MAIKTTVINVVFQAIQAVASLALAAIAIWAAFFTSLPETLEIQLRSELALLNEDLLDSRNSIHEIEETKSNLEKEISKIEIEKENGIIAIKSLQKEVGLLKENLLNAEREYKDVLKERLTLNKQILNLKDEKETLQREIEGLAAAKATYALTTQNTVLEDIVSSASYELAVADFVTEIAARYGEHRTWLQNAREQKRLEQQYKSLSNSDKFSSSNPIAERYYKNITSPSSPDFWLGFPSDPKASAANPNLKISTNLSIILNNIGKPETLHSKIINWYFDKVVSERGAIPLSPKTLVEKMKQHVSFQELLDQERADLEDILQEMLENSPVNEETDITIFFESEPTASQIINEGKSVKPNMEDFRSYFYDFFGAMGVKVPVYD